MMQTPLKTWEMRICSNRLATCSCLLSSFFFPDYSTVPSAFPLIFQPPFQMPKTRAQVRVDRHSQSLDDVRLFPAPAPLGTVLAPDSSNSYTFGLPQASTNAKLIIDEGLYPLSHCQTKSFYGRRSSNCLSLDMLGDEQFLEFIL